MKATKGIKFQFMDGAGVKLKLWHNFDEPDGAVGNPPHDGVIDQGERASCVTRQAYGGHGPRELIGDD